ncbi:hypothetical protein HKX48_000246 [Thoreauomyces humboldtii]|nr:hypothetical protein HKX48_000246 [Thoreauomyces humboldtii]
MEVVIKRKRPMSQKKTKVKLAQEAAEGSRAAAAERFMAFKVGEAVRKDRISVLKFRIKMNHGDMEENWAKLDAVLAEGEAVAAGDPSWLSKQDERSAFTGSACSSIA